MRAASRITLALVCLCLLGAATGCTSATKRHYLQHLSISVAPAAPDRELAAALAAARGTSGTSGTALAAVETEE